ncbi:hypothetical protein HDU92_003137 [Lobulomyces angularis]|nr:hypothetical protein HDU92_003137 [Lobulomyces angularis]
MLNFHRSRSINNQYRHSLNHCNVQNFKSTQFDIFHNNAVEESTIDETALYYSAPFQICYNNSKNDGKLLAVVEESGFLDIIDTRFANNDPAYSLEHRNRWQVNENAVFDVCWSLDDLSILTGGGDRTAMVWDVETRLLKNKFVAHESSIKSISANPHDPFVFATSSRDGNIMIWDLRCKGVNVKQVSTEQNSIANVENIRPSNSNLVYNSDHQIAIDSCSLKDNQKDDNSLYFRTLKPFDKINFSHLRENFNSLKRKKRSSQKKSICFSQSVSCVKFLVESSNKLISSGTGDGLIKIWDIRHGGYYSIKNKPQPYDETSLNENWARPYGYTSISLDPNGLLIYASCTDNSVYQFTTANLKCPLKKLTSPSLFCSSFYIKTSISPDGNFLLSGSLDGGIHCWDLQNSSYSSNTLLPDNNFNAKISNTPKVGKKKMESIIFRGHFQSEVCCVEWNKRDFNQFSSGSDDGLIRVWNLDDNKSKLRSDSCKRDFDRKDLDGQYEKMELDLKVTLIANKLCESNFHLISGVTFILKFT